MFRAVNLTFTINKVDGNGVIEFIQINNLWMPKDVYNKVLRDEKIDKLLNNEGKISIADMYFALLKHGEGYEIDLVEFKPAM